MFRTLLITTSTLDNLPEEVYATMKLYYYDDSEFIVAFFYQEDLLQR